MITTDGFQHVLEREGYEVHVDGHRAFATNHVRRLVAWNLGAEWEVFLRGRLGTSDAGRVFVRTETDLRQALTVEIPRNAVAELRRRKP